MQNQIQPEPLSVMVKPPQLYFAAIIIGGFIHLLWPLPLGFPLELTVVGLVLMIMSTLLMIWAMREFRQGETAVPHKIGASTLVTTGPYRFTRNPMYLSLTLLQLGIALIMGSAWVLLALIPVLVIMSEGVIAREETYMTHKFGQRYLDYKTAVRRWI
jgi:protein-S-isoprenylcysteine O-methyltransferase Ste14